MNEAVDLSTKADDGTTGGFPVRPQSAAGPDPAETKLPDRHTLKQFAEALVSVSGVPGICIAVRSGDEAYTIAVGKEAGAAGRSMPVKARFRIGCLGKTLLCAAALELARAGALDLAAPISGYLNELEGTPNGDRVNVQHLMCHAPGYAGISFLDARTARMTWCELIEHVRAAPLLFQPGSVFDYEQSAGALLGAVLSRATSRPTSELVEEMILRPLWNSSAGPVDVPFEQPAHSSCKRGDHGLSNVWTAAVSNRAACVDDLVTLATALTIGSARVGSGRFTFSADTTRGLTRRSVPVPEVIGSPLSHCLPIGEGLGLAEFRGGVIGRDGTGGSEVVGFRVWPEGQLALAVGVNAHAALVRWRLIDAVLAELGLAVERRTRSAPIGIDAHELAGRYVGSSGFEASVTTNGNELNVLLRYGASQPTTLTAAIDDNDCLSVGGQNRAPGGIAFFRDPSSGGACLMIGLCALKKVSNGLSLKETVRHKQRCHFHRSSAATSVL